MAQQLEGPFSWLNALMLLSIKILSNFRTSPAFLFCSGPHELRSQPAMILQLSPLLHNGTTSFRFYLFNCTVSLFGLIYLYI